MNDVILQRVVEALHILEIVKAARTLINQHDIVKAQDAIEHLRLHERPAMVKLFEDISLGWLPSIESCDEAIATLRAVVRHRPS